jgi:hypothetical protein
MLTKIYFALWFAVILLAGLFYAAGNMTDVALVAFGFVAFGMTFMGMMSVLPTAVHDSLLKH